MTTSAEVYRKIVHGLLGLSVAVAPTVVPFKYIVIGLTLLLVGIIMSQTAPLRRSIRRVRRRTWGEIAFVLGLLLSASLFYTTAPLAFQYGVLVLALADAAAALVGQQWGQQRLPLPFTRKTWEGTLAFAIITFSLTMVFGSVAGQSLSAAIISSFGLTVLLAAIEAVLARGLDNFFLPVVASLLAMVLW